MSPDVLLECPRTSFRDVLRVNVMERVWHSPLQQELGEMTLSYYDSNENADYEFGEMTLTNSNENAVYEFGEMTLSNYDHNESSDYEFGEMTPMRMPTRSSAR